MIDLAFYPAAVEYVAIGRQVGPALDEKLLSTQVLEYGCSEIEI